MNTDEIYGVIRSIEDESGKNAKQELLRENDSPELRKVLLYALDPFKTYGIKKIPKKYKVCPPFKAFDEKTWELLDKLAARELTGHAALKALADELGKLSVESATLLESIIKKDLRAGIAESTVTRALGELIPKFDVMLAETFDEEKVTFPAIVQPKIDGIRCIVIVNEGIANAFTRSGKSINTIDHILNDLKEIAPVIDGKRLNIAIDGELTSGEHFNDTGALRKKGSTATDAFYHVFDVIALTKDPITDLRKCVLRTQNSKRLSLLSAIFKGKKFENVGVLEHKECLSVSEVMDCAHESWKFGQEGVIVKNCDAEYQFKRSKAWMKIKKFDTVDAEVSGAIEGTGKYRGMLGAVIVDIDGILVNVGSGFSDSDRANIWGEPEKAIGRLIEVGFHEKTPDGSLRHPRFIRFRDSSDAPGIKV